MRGSLIRGSCFVQPTLRRAFHRSLSVLASKGAEQHLSNPAHSPIPRPSRLERKQTKPKPFHPYNAKIGSYEQDVLTLEPGQPESVREIMKKLWLDPYARLVAGPRSLCCATGTHFPISMIINLRVALDNPSDEYLNPPTEPHPTIERQTGLDVPPRGLEKPRQQLWLVPDTILHPDYAASNPIIGDVDLKEPIPLGFVCSELVATRYLTGLKHSKRTLLVDLPHSLPPLPVIPRSSDSTDPSSHREVATPVEEVVPNETPSDDDPTSDEPSSTSDEPSSTSDEPSSTSDEPSSTSDDSSSTSSNAISFSASPIRLSADLLDQISYQLLLRIQQELEILCAHVQACPSLAGRRVLRLVDDEERDSMRDEDWLDPAFIPNGGNSEAFGERVIAVLDLGTRKGEEEPGGFLRSVGTPRPTVDRTRQKGDKRPRSKKPPVAPTSTGRTGKNVIPPRSPRVLSPLIRSIQLPSSDTLTNRRTDPEQPLEKSTTAPKDVPVYPLDLLFPNPKDQLHLSSRLEHLLHLSTIDELPPSSAAGMTPPSPLNPSAQPRTYALLLHPSLLGPYGIDTFPLFRALWRLRLWKDDCAGWDDASRTSLWESLGGSLESAEDKKARREKEETEALKSKMNKLYGLNL